MALGPQLLPPTAVCTVAFVLEDSQAASGRRVANATWKLLTLVCVSDAGPPYLICV